MTIPRQPRISARTLLFDTSGRVVLIRRTRPGHESYLTTPGGGVLEGESYEAAAARECAEELGATITVGPVGFVSYGTEPSFNIQYFLLARLDSIDPDLRTGHEFSEPERGEYATVHVDPGDEHILSSLRPSSLIPILVSHGRYLAVQADALTAGVSQR